MATKTWSVQVGLKLTNNGTKCDKINLFISSGTRQNIQIWDLQRLALTETSQEMAVKVWMLSYCFPMVYVVGGEEWKGFKIFNVTTGNKLRDIKVRLQPFWTSPESN